MKEPDWNIKSRSDHCTQCEKPFEDKDTICSQLVFGEEGYARGDFCETCWEQVDHARALSHWKAIFHVPPPPPEDPLKKENIESMLRRLMKEDLPEYRNTIYILAIMLERKRILAEQSVNTREDGATIRVYEHKKSGEVFLIADPHLKLVELEEVQQEVVDMLSRGISDPARHTPDIEQM